MLFSDAGKAVRFDENDVRPMGRTARGVRGMMLDDGQHGDLACWSPRTRQQTVLTATENGYRQAHADRRVHAPRPRHQGMIAIDTSERNGKVVAATLVRGDDEVMLITTGGVLIRTRVTRSARWAAPRRA